MRLIDADKLIEIINKKILISNTPTRDLDDIDEGFLIGEESAYRDMIDIISEQPTTYGIEIVKRGGIDA